MSRQEVVVKDNFLPQEQFAEIENLMMGSELPWYYNPTIDYYDNDIHNSFQFTHLFVNDGGKIVSPYYKILFPLIKKINPEKIYRIKANLTTKKETNHKSMMHVDTDQEKIKTAVYYCNSNNGSTLFQNGKRIDSKANRIVVFDGHQKHCGVDCTDENVRVVINFNYFDKK